MNGLAMIEKKETLTSLEILDQINFFRKEEDNKTELRHDTLLNIIREEFSEEISLQKILESTYKTSRGKEYPMFILTLSQSKQILMRESKFVRKAVINYVERLEDRLRNIYQVPQNFKEALMLAAEQAEQIEALQLENQVKTQAIEEFKPIQEYVDTILACEDTMCVTQIAADYGMSGRQLNKILNKERIIRNVSGQWLLYKYHMNKGYTKSETVTVKRKDGTDKLILNTKWTQKGRLRIHEILTKSGIKANMDKNKPAI